MAFTSWDDLISDLKNALAEHVSGGSAMTREYTVNGKRHVLKSPDEIEAFLALCYRMKAVESAGNSRKSYGRPRRFQ